nr:uncharacterized protein LOC105338041 [Crassostrea gigas]XP_034307345.1 uncharacterized protein LOC105338041 [Crassostrea gigas]
MKSIFVITLFIAALPGLCWSMPGITWFKAQAECKNKNQALTICTNKSSTFYWTGVYNRTSHWIKLLGCYNASSVQLENEIIFSISSPPLCQEYCLQKNILEFAVKGNSCICLPNGFDDLKNRLPPSKCTYMCDKALLMSSECGGESAFNIFSTETSILDIKSRCLSLQCGTDSKLVDTDCRLHLPVICSDRKITSSHFNGSSPTTDNNLKWRDGMNRCKSSGVYLIGKINLTNIVSACQTYTHTPRWIGVVKENYISYDQGNDITESKQMISYCQQCRMMKNDLECKYVQCTKKLKSKVYCSKVTHASTPLSDIKIETTVMLKKTATTSFYSPKSTDSPATLYKTSSSYQQVQTGHDLIELSRSPKDGSTVGTVIPVVVVILVLGCCAVAVVFYYRRLKHKQEKEKKVKSVSTMENENYTYTESNDVHRDSILQQSNPTYHLTNDAILGSESPYKEADDGTYDHLGDKNTRKRRVEGIYNCTSSAKLSDVSDYDIANHKPLNEEDNDYDHAGVGKNTYGQYNSASIRESDYSDLS